MANLDDFVADINDSVNDYAHLLYKLECEGAETYEMEFYNANELDDMIEDAISFYEYGIPIHIAAKEWNSETKEYDIVIYEWGE